MSPRRKELRWAGANPVVRFIDEHLQVSEQGEPFRLYPHQREVLELAFQFDEEGRLPWDTIVYACVKKSGKTSLSGAVTLAWAFTQEPPNEVYILANDEEQARSRVYGTMARMVRKSPTLLASIVRGEQGLGQGGFELTNGTVVRAIASEASSAAGSNHGMTSWDELWAYASERARRLWSEMTPVPTRRNSIRFVSTYAGYENEPGPLWDLYLLGVGPEEHKDGQGERIHPTLPIYANREARLLVYWDHEPRMPWQTPAYYTGQRKDRTLRPVDYLRFHENRWATSSSTFITPELWDPCVDAALRPALGGVGTLVAIAADAATRKDSAAVVAVTLDPVAQRVRLVNAVAWYPTSEARIDLEATIEATVLDWAQRYDVATIRYDPWQLEVIGRHWVEAGLPAEEFPQTSDRLTAMGQALFALLKGRNLQLYADDRMREHALNTVAVETPRGFRIAKDKARKKIDLIVALAMAALACLEHAGEGSLPMWVFDKSEGPPPASEEEAKDREARENREQHRHLWGSDEAWRGFA